MLMFTKSLLLERSQSTAPTYSSTRDGAAVAIDECEGFRIITDQGTPC